MAPLEILIVGCSIAGPTLASFLLLSPLPYAEKPHITLLERAPYMRKEGQNVDVRGAGVTIIRKLGIEQVIRDSTTGEEGVEWVDRDNKVWASFPADKSGKLQTPTSDIEILRGRLAEICWKRSKSISEEVQRNGGAGVNYVFGDQIHDLEQHGSKVYVTFEKSKERRSYDLVVGADGLQSATRNMVWGPENESQRLKMLGMFGGYFSMPPGGNDSSWRRWFHTNQRRSIMLRPDDQRGRTTAHLIVVNDHDQRLVDAAVAARAKVDEQKSLLAEYFRGTGWETDRIIEEMMPAQDFYYDMVAQVKMEKWSKGRVVLLGDAAYCASPISGMGTTLAFSGAYYLAGAILRHSNELETAFTEYEENMRPTVERAQKLFPGAPHSLHPETEWGLWMLHSIIGFMSWTGLVKILIQFKGPPANNVPVEDFGFPTLPEWSD